jgi:hypothetical protein
MSLEEIRRYHLIANTIESTDLSPKTAQDVVAEYSKALREDYISTINYLISTSRPSDKSILFKHPVRFRIEENFQFNAFVHLEDDQVITNVFYGLLLSLDDLFSRLGCSADFYSFNASGERIWKGTECIWFHPERIPFKPEVRYHNYAFTVDPMLALNASPTSGLGLFYGAIAWGDLERIGLADFMSKIGLMWVLMHEEGHYTNGHLSHLVEKYSYLNQSLQIGEATNNIDSDSAEFAKIKEWQADVSATNAVVDYFLNAECFPSLPAYCKKASSTRRENTARQVHWLFRAIIVSIGTTVLVLQKSQSIHGASERYPLPRTRLLLSIIVAFSRATDPRFNNLVLDAMRDDSQFIFNCIIGAFEDLLTASGLINREQHVDFWDDNSNETPLIRKTHQLGLIDSEFEATVASLSITGLLNGMEPTELLAIEYEADPIKLAEANKLSTQWLAEFYNLRTKVQGVEDFMTPYSNSVAPSYFVKK